MPKDLVADLNRRDERLGFFRLDAPACTLLRDLRPLMAKSLPDIARGFYERLATVPQLSPLIAGHGKVAHLSAAQVQHWNTLFSADFGEEYFDRARRVGMAHDRIGLEPRWYIAAYSHFIEALFGVVLDQRWPRARTQGALAAILRAALLDMELAVSSYAETGEAKRLKHEMLVLTDNIERDIDQTIQQVAEESGRMVDGAEQLGLTATALHEAATVMAAAADQAMANVQAVAAATEELEGTSRAIADQVVRSTAVTDEVAHRAGRTAETVSRLEEAAARINDVVKLIQSIAAQTKLLALNATIEAARAGEAGRGFAIVAAEVKTLARQTEDAIGTVSSQASNISSVTEATGHSVHAVVDDIHRVDEISAEVRCATDQQRQATGEISRGASAAADKARELAERADGILNHARVTGDTAAEVRDLAGHVNEQLVGLRRRVTEVLRQSSAGDRRVGPRHRAVLAFEAEFGGQRFRGRTIDLSMRGCLLEQCQPPLMVEQRGHIRIVGVGDFPGHVCGVDGAGVHICFDGLDPSVRLSLERTLARLREDGSVLPS